MVFHILQMSVIGRWLSAVIRFKLYFCKYDILMLLRSYICYIKLVHFHDQFSDHVIFMNHLQVRSYTVQRWTSAIGEVVKFRWVRQGIQTCGK